MDLLGLLPDQLDQVLGAHFEARGKPAYRARQVRGWIYERLALSFDEMHDLPVEERRALSEAFVLATVETAHVAISTDGTAKHLWRMADAELIESVLIPAPDRLTLCVSSQAGCAMACVFCATGWSGYRRQLTPGEIVAQYRGSLRWARENERGDVTNIVFMGMGEPLANTEAVLPALTILNQGYGLGARRITVSTVGVAPGIRELAERPEQFRLAVSLHAPNHELRQQIVPLEKRYPMPELLESLRAFDAAGGRRITFEYVMIDGLTDAPELADQLAAIAREFHAHVNLIPYNPIPGPEWKQSPRASIRAFRDRLEHLGTPATIRASRGQDIAAACGQLRAEHETRPPRPFVKLMESRGATVG